MEVLDATNAALKTRGVKGRIVVAKDRLFLRGTFTAADGTRKDRRIALGLNAHQGQLLEAEARAPSAGPCQKNLGQTCCFATSTGVLSL